MSSVTSSTSQINSTKKYSDNLFNVFYPAIISKYKTDKVKHIFLGSVRNFLKGKKNIVDNQTCDIISIADIMTILNAQKDHQVKFQSLYNSLSDFNLKSFIIPRTITAQYYVETENDNIGNMLKPDFVIKDYIYQDITKKWKYSALISIYICTSRQMKNAYTNYETITCPKNKYWVLLLAEQTLLSCPSGNYCESCINKLAGIQVGIGLLHYTDFDGNVVENVEKEEIAKVHVDSIGICSFSPKHTLGVGVSKITIDCPTKKVVGKILTTQLDNYLLSTDGENIIGSRLAIKWAGGTYYNGTVTGYNENEQYKYEITYDDTDVRRYNFNMAGSIGLVAFNTHGNHHVKIVKLALADNDNIFYLDQCEGKIIVLPHYCNFKTLNLSASLHPMASAINKEELLSSFETIKKFINIPGRVEKGFAVQPVVKLARAKREELNMDKKTWQRDIAPHFGTLLKAIRKFNNYKKVRRISMEYNEKKSTNLKPLEIKRHLSNEGIGLLNRAMSFEVPEEYESMDDNMFYESSCHEAMWDAPRLV